MEIKLATTTWMCLTAAQRALLLDALSSIRVSKRENIAEIDALSDKLSNAELRQNITVCIANGQFQCAHGNPFPIRVCDYDGFDLPDIDEHGRPCEIIWEPADDTAAGI